jgi:hypothetical protein
MVLPSNGLSPEQDEIEKSKTAKRLTLAWSMINFFLYNAKRQLLIADLLQLLMLLVTLASTSAACTYMYYLGGNAASDGVLPILIVLNLVLPLVLTVLKGLFGYLNPYAKYCVLKMAAAKIEVGISTY